MSNLCIAVKPQFALFSIVYSVPYSDQCTQFISSTKCTVLIMYKYYGQISDLLRYKPTIFRKKKCLFLNCQR